MIRPLNLDAAIYDLRVHNLNHLSGNLSRLIYLAATRDYNTGKYHHDGLAIRFSPNIANQALAACHRDTFEHLGALPLEQLVAELEAYVVSNSSEEDELIKLWISLEPFRVVIPVASDPISAQLFCSNVRIALAILDSRAKRLQKNQPGASRRP